MGNPNTGKTTLFNMLAGTKLHVGNYPGVTIEKVVGACQAQDSNLELVDLPGTYSLSPYSIEEGIVRRYLLEESPDVLVLVVDASNLRRNLYLAIQLLELGLPLVIALNMIDVARQDGVIIDTAKLEQDIGIPVVPVVAKTGLGLRSLIRRIVQTGESTDLEALKRLSEHPVVAYGDCIEEEVNGLAREIRDRGIGFSGAPRRWIAIKLLESDRDLLGSIEDKELLNLVSLSFERVEAAHDDSPASVFAEMRYQWIEEICRKAVLFTNESGPTLSDKVDSVLTNRFIGIPAFFVMMYFVFHFTFYLGSPPVHWLEQGFDYLGRMVSSYWEPGSNDMARSLLVDGIIGGVGGVVVFLPNIVFLFLAISMLEETGYMARAAFLMDRIMNKFGLHGKSFIPMLLGFGCNVPAIMATRSMEDRTAQRITMLVIPLMSCGARLPIYALIIPAFFPLAWQGITLLSLYLIGILLALVAAKVLRLTLYRGAPPSFLIELPPYKLPSPRQVLQQSGRQSWMYLKKAGTIILAASIVFWFLGQFPSPPDEAGEVDTGLVDSVDATHLNVVDGQPVALEGSAQNENKSALEQSLLGQIGRGMEPVLSYCGFDWKVSTALVGAIVAKEIFVAQLGVIYSLDSDHQEEMTLRQQLQEAYSPLQAYCIMLFCLIAFPCVATVAVTKKESGSWRFALLQMGSLTLLAWVLTTSVYQMGRFFS